LCPINIIPELFLPLNLTFWYYILFKDSLNYFYFQLIRWYSCIWLISLSLIFKVTLRSGTIVVSSFKTFMNFSGIHFFILENSEIQFLLSINKLYISWQILKFVLFESQISFIVRKLLCRNEVNTNGLFLKDIEELQNILIFRMESTSLLHNWITIGNIFKFRVDTFLLVRRFPPPIKLTATI
jgi:hypothetical protein